MHKEKTESREMPRVRIRKQKAESGEKEQGVRGWGRFESAKRERP